ncbi:MAG TPA: hypothetical protein VK892_03470, partial [Pyrinomonadaceae bacterium]|nr:hypothetical protein [Pyrinomonadaceae bacterium]
FLAFVFAPDAQAQNNLYPNELKGYEFLGKGRLKGLKPGVSTTEDVKRVFGENCESVCDYDADWSVHFRFFENNWIKEETDPKGKKTVYNLDPKYIGILRRIELRPKKTISFANVSFPNPFQKFSRSEVTKEPNSSKTKMVTYELFQDSDGLVYELFSGVDYDNIKAKNERVYNKKDLFSVIYNISPQQEKIMYILQKK